MGVEWLATIILPHRCGKYDKLPRGVCSAMLHFNVIYSKEGRRENPGGFRHPDES
jgi:hypothetical protein